MNFPKIRESEKRGLEHVVQVLLDLFVFLILHFRINNFNFTTESFLFLRHFLGKLAPPLALRSCMFLGIKNLCRLLVEKSAPDFCSHSLCVNRAEGSFL